MEWWSEDGVAWRAYAASILRAGAEPVHLSPSAFGHETTILASLQGIVFSGGLDIDLHLYPNPPDQYGEDLAEVMERYNMLLDPERDQYELPLMKEALEADIPILGICRGCQLMQVASGGSLVLDIDLQTPGAVPHQVGNTMSGRSRRHDLTIVPGTLLAQALPPEEFTWCNSRHHQAVQVTDPMRSVVSALSPVDGVVEGIEIPDRRWAVGVQWHPEHPTDPDLQLLHQPLFDCFVRQIL